jgi:hypothetical protein
MYSVGFLFHAGVSGKLRKWRLEPGNPAAFLIDGNKQRRLPACFGILLHLTAQAGDLVRGRQISCKENQAAGFYLINYKPEIRVEFGPLKAHHQALPGQLLI